MPKKTEGYTQLKAHAKQDRKRREAYARQDKYDSLTLTEQIALVKSRGGSVFEIARLNALSNPTPRLPVTKPVATPVAVVETKPKKSRKSDVNRIAKAARPSKL